MLFTRCEFVSQSYSSVQSDIDFDKRVRNDYIGNLPSFVKIHYLKVVNVSSTDFSFLIAKISPN